MDFPTLSQVFKNFFDEFFKSIFQDVVHHRIEIKGEFSFPNLIRIAESPNHFIIEFLGTVKIKNQDEINISVPSSCEKIGATSNFFSSGLHVNNKLTAIFNVENARLFSLSDLTLTTDYDKDIFIKKINFPISKTKIKSANVDIALNIGSGCKSAYFRRINIIIAETFKIHFRFISTAFVVEKTINEQTLRNWLLDRVSQSRNSVNRDILGLNIDSRSSLETFSKELLSLTDQGVKELILDKFLQKHIKFFVEALGYKDGLSQKSLKWIEKIHADDPDESIPDYLMLREDGYYDILDLKTSALKYESLVVGGKKRTRFNAYVSDLIAQLVVYERYFEGDLNSQWAKEEYGIEVSNPRLVGIVGNYDNFEKEEISLALRQYKDNIIILSYNDLINLLRNLNRNNS